MKKIFLIGILIAIILCMIGTILVFQPFSDIKSSNADFDTQGEMAISIFSKGIVINEEGVNKRNVFSVSIVPIISDIEDSVLKKRMEGLEEVLKRNLKERDIMIKNLSLNLNEKCLRITLYLPVDISLKTGEEISVYFKEIFGVGYALTLQEVNTEDSGKPPSEISPSGKVVLEGNDFISVSYSESSSGFYNIDVELTDAGTAKFSDATARLDGQTIGIFVDETCFSAPSVLARINSSKFVIEGAFSLEEVISIVDRIRINDLGSQFTIIPDVIY